MTIPLQIRVFDNQQLAFSADVTGRVEFGRQKDQQDTPQSTRAEAGFTRVVVAHQKEDSVSRRHAVLEPANEFTGRLTNTSTTQMIVLAGEPPLRPQESRDVSFPLLMTLGRKVVRVQPEVVEIESLPAVTVPPGGRSRGTPSFQTLAATAAGGIEPEAVIGWLQTVLDLLQSAVGSQDFFVRAAHALVDLVALDEGCVLLWGNDDWVAEARHSSTPGERDAGWRPSQRILSRVREEKRTFWQMPGVTSLPESSLAQVRAVVVAPILDSQGNVIGALYGDRRLDRPHMPPARITRLEAMVVELLARGVATGLARLEQERAALRARVLFEQFVTPEVARQLDAHPDLLQGRELEVTLLFCDVRNFSRISEKVGPSTTVAWIGSMMDALSDCVAAQEGTLVEYIGDALLAMWGAPVEQADHAARACRAALAMLEQLPRLNERWQTTLQERVRLGIGINTGLAQVGNTGSKRKPQYGPLGNTVNLASRVQGATKYLKTRLVITEATRTQLDESFAVRRLCQVRVVNIAEPVNLYELAPAGQPNWDSLKERYERALDEFEGASLRDAVGGLAGLIHDYPEDGPTLVFLARAINALNAEASSFDPIWELPGK